MESVKIRKQYSPHMPVMESGFSPSRTQPNDVLSVEEIIRRSANGIPIGNMIEGSYDDEEHDLPDDYYQMDKLEKIQYARDRAEQLEQMKTDYEKSRKEQAAAKAASEKQRSESPKVEDTETESEDTVGTGAS